MSACRWGSARNWVVGWEEMGWMSSDHSLAGGIANP
jgi:hypothetical protein